MRSLVLAALALVLALASGAHATPVFPATASPTVPGAPNNNPQFTAVVIGVIVACVLFGLFAIGMCVHVAARELKGRGKSLGEV